LHAKVRRALLAASLVLTATAVARAQPADPLGDVLANSASSPALPTAPQPYQSVRQPLSAADASAFRGAMESARRGDVSGARSYIATISDKIARKTATWALVDAAADTMGFNDVDMARRELEGWPREAKRRAAAERLLETSGKSPRETVEWFGGSEPQTAQGAMALAAAYRGVGKTEDATKLIRKWWRGKGFEADVQRTMMARFGDVLTPEDYGRRADVLLYGAQGPAARDLIALLPADQQQAALARIALRADARDADSQFAALTPALSASPGVAFERAAWLRRKGQEADAINLLSSFPKEVVTAEQGDRIWDERHRLTLFALRNGDAREAYLAAADSGLTSGADAADAEFYAGWIALSKLKEPARAAKHFAALEKIGSSPITRGRALYWLGRSAEAQGDQAGAQAWYAKAAEYPTVFYGQLAAEKLGRRLELGQDPTITDRHREKFEGRETVQAARLLFDQGRPDLFRVFVLALDDTLPTLEDQALLVDMARGYGDQDISMKAVRAAAQRGFVLPVRGYPFRSPPSVGGGPEPALVLGITRQESGFDPLVRSGVGARGMMQLMPATAQIVARKVGVSYSPSMLDDPDYNMRLGSSFLGQLVDRFSGSYVMATAAYNAGPGRPTQWSAFCGDPRSSADAVDFIECIPFSETRNYVMRVMEGMQVYRSRLNGGSAPITLSSDLMRGSYAYPSSSGAIPTATTTTAATGSGTMAPISN
jgi:soluble lytic murein transglycosylase